MKLRSIFFFTILVDNSLLKLLNRLKGPFLESGTSLLISLKQKVVELASNCGVLETIQKSAQACLQAGWSILLPTAEERARALSTLIGKKCLNSCFKL